MAPALTDSLLTLPGVVTSTTGLGLPSGLAWDHYVRIGGVLLRTERAVRWWIGDWLAYGEHRWGEKYTQAVAEVERMTGLTFDPGALANLASVSNRVELSRRREGLTWSHHAEVAKLPPAEQTVWLERTESEKWSHKQLRDFVARDNAPPPPEPPVGRYRTIVVDPPWAYGNKSGRQRPDYSDRTMGLDEIAAFDLKRWIPEDDGGCHLYLWVTDAYAGDVYRIVRAWGFAPKAWLIWVKDRIGMGNYYRHQHEACVFAVQGRLRLMRRDAPTVFTAAVTEHSVKPEAFYSLVESCSHGPYLDVFARQRRAGWDVFGDEIEAHAPYQMRIDGNNDSAVLAEES